MPDQLTAIAARWTVLPRPAGGVEAVENVTVLVRGRRIEGVVRGPVAVDADRRIVLPRGIVLPGFVNLHNHALNGPVFRGIVDDVGAGTPGGVAADAIVYGLLLPLGDLASEVLSGDELRAVYRLAVLELLRSGTTSVLDMPRAQHHGFLDAATELGLRAFAAPYVFSAPSRGLDDGGRPRYVGIDEDASLAAAIAVADRYDEGRDGRIRVGFGPHATDTCSPRLLRRIADLASERDTFVTIHVAQSRHEVETVRARHGRTPVEYLRDTGLLGPRTVVAHGVHTEDGDLGLLRESGTTLAHCPLTFARSGVTVAFERFHGAGVRTGIGTDAYSFDHFGELRAAGLIAKLTSGDGGTADAATLLAAATSTGGEALGGRFGRIEPGLLADLIAVDLSAPHLQPVRDPLRNLVWNATPADVAVVMVDGRVVVDGGGVAGCDERRVVDEAAAAVERLWHAAEAAGVLPPIERTPA
ncbi:ethylammeline chlorohydrolase [Jiangella ureilytica]|uniref:Ethylammeline chlorohydrolase n=1 Tax=Jiangella ureilytica TaxID=2530374 RepID=A0A4R4RNA2_9ACTN|nr:amidohydrolase family protein [Jiangella ureilytica]TDC49993.1 ethylammeline chlorohydrolase [Jiangella ureilytica]